MFANRFGFTSRCLQEAHVLFRMFSSALPPDVCRRLMSYLGCSVRLYLQLFVGGSCLIQDVQFGFTSRCLQEAHVLFRMFSSALPPDVCRRLMSYLGCSVRLYLQMFVGGSCLIQDVQFGFTSRCLQEAHVLFRMFGSALPPDVCRRLMSYLGCSVRLYLQLFVGGSCLIQDVRFGFTSRCLQEAHVLFRMFGSALPPDVCRRPMSYLGCSVRLYLQMFVGGSCLIQDVQFGFTSRCLQEAHVLFRMFSSALPPDVCRRLMSYLGCSVRLYLQMFVGGPCLIQDVQFGFTSRCLQEAHVLFRMFGSALPPDVCRRLMSYLGCSVRLYLQLFVGGSCLIQDDRFGFTSSCLQEAHVLFRMFSSALPPDVCRRLMSYLGCSVRLYLQMFVGGSCLIQDVQFGFTSRCLQEAHVLFRMFSSALPPDVCRRLMSYLGCSVRLYLQLFVGGSCLIQDVQFGFTSRCLQEAHVLFRMFSSALPPDVCRRLMSYLGCSVRLYLQMFVGGSCLIQDVQFGFTSSCLQEAHVLFRMFSSALPPVVCRRLMSYLGCSVRLYLQMFVGGSCLIQDVQFGFTSRCLQEAHVLFRMFGSALPPDVCRRLMSYLGCSVRLYLQMFVGGSCLIQDVQFGFTSRCLQEAHVLFRMFGSALPPVVCRRLMSYLGCSVRLYLQMFVGGSCLIQDVQFGFTSRCLQEAHVLFRMFSSALPPVVCRRLMSYLG